jgi:capsular exopolysaccharide synthesis family protein
MSQLPDHLREPTASRAAYPKAAITSAEYVDEKEESAPRGIRVSARLVGRALRRHWWQALLLWGVGSAFLVTMAQRRILPTYDATARVRVELPEQSPYVTQPSSFDLTEFKETQVKTVTSPVVLSLALTTHPELHKFPRLQNTQDAETEIRQAVRVEIVPKTSLIEIGMTSLSPDEAVSIVNAVVEAYLAHSSSTSNEDILRQIDRLKIAAEKHAAELNSKRELLRSLSNKIGAADAEGLKNSNMITTEDYRQWSNQLTEAEFARISTEAELQELRAQKELPSRAPTDEEIESALKDAFYDDPRVIAVKTDLDRARLRLENVRLGPRNTMDPAIGKAEKKVQQLKGELAKLWASKRPLLERELRAQPAEDVTSRAIRELEVRLAAEVSKENHLRSKLDQMKIRSRDAGSDGLSLEFTRIDAEDAGKRLRKVEDTLNQLEHEARSPHGRVRKEYFASKPSRPNASNRKRIMMLAPIVVLFLVTGLFVALERLAGRVSDPEELASRAQLQVLGVVPPLPDSTRPNSFLGGETRAQRNLDEFIQNLDHLRVVLCARPDRWGRERHCVLITSACASEGKTTLAVQLAERCVNAGLMTLLIDADLRNPTLSRMLDSAGCDGLVNVLQGETAPEQAIRVIGDAGGFHFLPTGCPRIDPSRLLQNDAMGQLLARARESFDMIIIDTSPVLPVPDALLIGRWCDGVVLAVRHNTSRFMQVERAQRRLANVGVPILGAVVNGVRPADSSYGNYYAYRGRPDPDPPAEET